MITELDYYWCNGNGNSFMILYYTKNSNIPIFDSKTIQNICINNKNRVDGLILLNEEENKIQMVYYNNDERIRYIQRGDGLPSIRTQPQPCHRWRSVREVRFPA